MRKDYHMHPTVLKDPEKVRSFVEKAKEKNIKEICFTDHMPLSCSKAKDRLLPGTVKEYCARVREIAEEYQDQISIHCGIEVDFHPSVLSEVEAVLAEGDFDYVLASSHMHIFNQNFAAYTPATFAAEALENSIRAAETGWFDTVAHVDMYRFVFQNPQRFPLAKGEYSPTEHRDLFCALFDILREKGMYLEINPHLAESLGDLSFIYPQESVLQWAMEKGVRFAYGSDAHKSESVGMYLDELEQHPLYGKALKSWEEGPSPCRK